MEFVVGIIVVWFIWKLMKAPAEQQQAIQEQRGRDFGSLFDQMYAAMRSDWSPPRDPDDDPTYVNYSLDVDKMAYFYSYQSVDDYVGEGVTRHLHRDARRVWFERLVEVKRGDDVPLDEFVAKRLYVPSRAAEHDEALADLERRVVATFASEWTEVRRDLSPWIETAYRRCTEFFDSHPGLYPDITSQIYASQHFDPKRIWTPPRHVTDRDFEASRHRVEAALAALEEGYATRKVPQHDRARLDWWGL
jgi:hypothetical protein